MIASAELNALTPVIIKALHGAFLLFFGVAVVFAGITVSKLRSPSDTYNPRQFTFGYFSLSAWILWVVQYFILAAPFLPFPTGASMATVLWLGVVQNALWVCAILSLRFEPLSRKLLTLPLLIVFSVVVALLAYKTSILSTAQLNVYVAVFDAFVILPLFMTVAIWLLQLGLSKVSAVAFMIHGYTQWIWRWLWLSSLATTPIVQVAFPVWRIILFIAWTRVVSEMTQRVQPAEQKLAQASDQTAGRIEPQRTPDLMVTLKVMISSTVEDLGREREAVDRTINGLKFTRFRAETLGSFPHPPEVICAFLAEHCDIFVLIIGERYGYTIKSRGISVVEFEYEVARKQDRGKILVYIKEGVTREPRLEEFVQRLEDFESGHFRTLFRTPEELPDKIRGDIARWALLRKPQQMSPMI